EIFPYIAHLLNGAEVEWKPLGEVCDKIFAGGTPASTKEEYYNGTIPWLRSGEINFNGIDKTEKTITELGFSKSSARWVRKNSVLLAMTGATVARSAVNNIELTANQSVCALETNESIIIYKYLYYCLANKFEALKYQGQGVLSSLNLTTIKKIEIPIPPLSVQQEIVRVLDKFTQLEAELKIELETELDCRKRQYEYYRDKLLSFNEVVGGVKTLIFSDLQWKTLGEVADFQNGFAFKSRLFRDNGEVIVRITNIDGKGVDLSDVKYFSISDYNTNMSPYKINKGDILIAMSGATTGKIGFYNYEYTSYLNQRVGKFIPKANILNNRYLYHYLLSKVEEIYIIAGGGAQPNLSSNKLMEKIQIPIPPIEEQERIAGILDKFDTLVNSIIEGLPREIELRRKQYEYYREKLLSFPKN
ncbi:MAG: restriction endonuclease subunit S, partial [Flavobacteriaceae bacterium]|nr:restriction endonuclease subunit S [Flavobacteriaceae bacterium]